MRRAPIESFLRNCDNCERQALQRTTLEQNPSSFVKSLPQHTQAELVFAELFEVEDTFHIAVHSRAFLLQVTRLL